MVTASLRTASEQKGDKWFWERTKRLTVTFQWTKGALRLETSKSTDGALRAMLKLCFSGLVVSAFRDWQLCVWGLALAGARILHLCYLSLALPSTV